jgi:hypothetical protein
MTMPHSEGWYNDPDGSDAERYFDGREWTPQRRRKPLNPNRPSQAPHHYGPPQAAAGPYVPPASTGPAGAHHAYPPAPPPVGYWPPPSGQAWHRLSSGAKIGWAVAIAIVLVIIASIVVSAEPWHSQRYKECRAAMEREGYKGDELKSTTQYCVDVTKP